jgi:protein disulfide-isomerase A6
LTPSNFKTIVDGTKHALIEFYAPWCGHCKSLAPEWAKLGKAVLASKDKDSIVIAKVDANEHSSLGTDYAVQGFPTIKYFAKGSSEPEEYNGGRTLEDFLKFLNSKTGSSLTVPREPSDTIDLDSTNFNRIVKDATKDVLVEFYAPWCGHCKRLAPDYEQVGATFKSDSNVVIAKMNADEAGNRPISQQYDVKGFPTIKFFPKDNKGGEEYNGGRTPEDFVEFINKRAGTERILGGLLSEKAGRVDALDTLAAEFLKSSDKKAALEKIQAEAKSSDSKFADLYVKAAEKIIAKGDEYVTKEKTRLGKLIDGKSSAAAKLDDMVRRRNVLEAF